MAVSIERLKFLRFFTPGIMCFLFIIVFGRSTGVYSIDFPNSLKDLDQTLVVLCLAFLYQLFPFREWSNYFFKNEIIENIKNKMNDIYPGTAPNLSEDAIMYIFYSFVDNDESLRVHMKFAYFNGYLWSSVADFRALCLIFCVVSLLSGFFSPEDVFNANAVAYLFLVVFSCFLSRRITSRHLKISDTQMRIIKIFHKDDLVKMMDKVSVDSSN